MKYKKRIVDLFVLQSQKRVAEQEIRDCKKELHNDFVRKNKKIFRMMDIAVVIIVLFNFAAITLTNTMVSKELHERAITEDRKVEFLEVNPVVAKEQGLKIHPESRRLINAAMIWLLKWFIIVWIYVHFRRHIYLNKHLTLGIIIVAMWFIMLGMDFFNNFGLTLGKYFAGG